MRLNDFPKLINNLDPFEATMEMEKLRQYNKEWIKQKSCLCRYEDFDLIEGQNRYTIEYDEVPFECLFLPDDNKKLYVMLSGGGTRTERKYPLFLRWKYKNFLKGNILCIDDPMYHFYPEYTHVMWYYGTREVSYLKLLIDIVKKFMIKLDILDEQVVFIGSSGGGYAALYCANCLDNSAAIAVNPQIVLKDWDKSVVPESFKKIGIDLSKKDKLDRNHIHLTNPKSKFAVIMNAKSLKEYQLQFVPFFEIHGITPSFGVTLTDNIITWVHSTNYIQPHSAVPCETSMVMIDYLLKKIRENEDINELTDLSILANQILHEKYDLKMKFENLQVEKKAIVKFFIRYISEQICDILLQKIPVDTPLELQKFLNYNYDIKYIVRSEGNIGYYIGEQQLYRYNIFYFSGNIYFRMKFSCYSSYFAKKEELTEYLESIRGKEIKGWFVEGDELIISIILKPDNAEKEISDFVDLTIKCLGKYFV